jgi:hypothetical protein
MMLTKLQAFAVASALGMMKTTPSLRSLELRFIDTTEDDTRMYLVVHVNDNSGDFPHRVLIIYCGGDSHDTSDALATKGYATAESFLAAYRLSEQ